MTGIDCFTPYYDPALKRRNVESLPTGAFRLIEGDLVDLDLAGIVSAGFDVVYHLAGQPGVRSSWGDGFADYTRLNVDATQKLLEAVLRSESAPRFVYASSSSVYGQSESYPTTENALPRPFSPYGVTKLAGEHLVTLYRENFGVDTTAFRFFTVYGPGQRPDMAFTRFLRAGVDGTRVTIYGTGEQIRDFTFVDDIVDALVRAAEAESPLPAVMNLSGGSSVSVNEVLDTISGMLDEPLLVDYVDSVNGDVTRTGGDSSLALAALGWKPQTSLRSGLAKQLEWARSVPA